MTNHASQSFNFCALISSDTFVSLPSWTRISTRTVTTPLTFTSWLKSSKEMSLSTVTHSHLSLKIFTWISTSNLRHKTLRKSTKSSAKIFCCCPWETESFKAANSCISKFTVKFMKVWTFQKLPNSPKRTNLKLNCGFWNISEAQISRLRLTRLKVRSFPWETKKTGQKDTLTRFLTLTLSFQQCQQQPRTHNKNDSIMIIWFVYLREF